MLSRPFYFALYLLGAEIFAVKLGPDESATASKQLDGGGGTGSHEIGFVMDQMPVIAQQGTRRHE